MAKAKSPPHRIQDIAFIFKDVSCTKPANKPLAEWLMFMLEEYKEELDFLYRESQLYVKHGGGSGYTKALWLKRLERNIKEFFKENI